jgi:predicted GNAT family acetyltransferase
MIRIGQPGVHYRQSQEIAGVYTPPEHRGKGYAYHALGFRVVGDYGMTLFPPATFGAPQASD